MNPLKTWLGYPYPLGATWMDHGVNFALFSANATAVELCLFDSRDSEHESVRIRLREQTNQKAKALLSADQYTKYEASRTFGRGPRGGGGPGGGGGGPGGGGGAPGGGPGGVF